MSSISRIYFCEDHFDLPNDMENYVQYQIMGSVSQLRLKPGCLRSEFECQPDRRKRTCSNLNRPYMHKKQKMTLLEECLNELVESSTVVASTISASLIPGDISNTTPDTYIRVLSQEEIGFQNLRTADKSVQVQITNKYRSKATQSSIKLMDQATSPLKSSQKSVSKSPFQVKRTIKL